MRVGLSRLHRMIVNARTPPAYDVCPESTSAVVRESATRIAVYRLVSCCLT
jgi:hypothetical protein